MISSLGSIGLGLVWGWLMGRFDSQIARPYVFALSLIGSTALLVLEVLWLAGWQSVVCFLLAVLVSLFLHTQWRKELRSRHRKS